MNAFLAAAVLPLAATPALAQDSTADITFTFETGQPSGQIMVALYDSQSAYDGGGRPVRVERVSVTATSSVVDFADLPAGDYAMRAFHDLNGDGEMSRNPFGMPTEPFAFSNNARGNMGPAGWDRAHFTVAGDTAQTINLAQ